MDLVTAARKVVELVVEDADIDDELLEARDQLEAAADSFESGLANLRSALDSVEAAAADVRESLEGQEAPEVPEGTETGEEVPPEGDIPLEGEDELVVESPETV